MDTPKTDYEESTWYRTYNDSKEAGWPSINYVVDSEFARQLERENNQLKNLLKTAFEYIKKDDGMTFWVENVKKLDILT